MVQQKIRFVETDFFMDFINVENRNILLFAIIMFKLRTCIHKNCYTKALIRKPYDTDLTDQEWAMIEPYFSKHRTYK